MRIVSGSTGENLYFVAVSTSDHISRVVGLTSFNVYASATSASTGSTYAITVAEVNSTQMPGVYRLHMNDSTLLTIPSGVDSREICLHIASSMDPVTRTFELYRRTATTGATLTVNSSGEPTNVMSKLTSIEANTTGMVTRLTSVDTNVTSILNKVTSIESNTTGMVVRLTSVDTNVTSILNKVTSIEANTTGMVTRLTSVDTNVTSILNKVTSIEANTTSLIQGVAVNSIAANAITASAIAANAITTAKITSGTFNQVADTFLDRDMSTGLDSGSSSYRTPRQALRFLRNKWSISAGTLTVYKEDDISASWTGAVTTDNTASPITANDPA